MSRSQRFIQDIVLVAIAQIFNSVSLGIVILPTLTKSYSCEIYGIWVQARIMVILFSQILGLHFGQSVVRYLSHENNKGNMRRALGAMLFTIILLSITILALANLLVENISYFMFGNSDYDIYVRLTTLWIFVTVIYNFLLSYFYARNEIVFLAIRQIIVSILSSGLVIVIATQGYSIEVVMESVITIQAISTLFLFLFIVKETGFPYPNTFGLKSFFSFSLPQIPNVVLLAIISSSDRYFITYFLGLAQTGIYSSSSALAGLLSLIYFPISVVLSPLLSRLGEDKQWGTAKSYLEFSTKIFLMLAIPTTVGLTILSQPLLRLLTTQEFLAGKELILLLSIHIMFVGLYQIEINVVYLLNRTKILLNTSAIAAILSVLLNIILLPRIGIVGAAISDVSVFGILAAIAILWAKKTIGFNIDIIFLVKVIVATLLMVVCLDFTNITGIMNTMTAIITGLTVFGLTLFLLRAFSDQDRQFVTNLVHGLFNSYSLGDKY